jgi:hypothetical protein
MDIPLVGGSFTWSGNHDPLVWSKVDRFLLSLDWEAHFPNVSQRRLPKVLSDHFIYCFIALMLSGAEVILSLRIWGLNLRVLWRG